MIDYSAVIPRRLRRVSYGLLLLTAGALLIFRLLVAWLAGQPALMQGWLTDALSQPATFGTLETGWHAWTPELRVHELQVWDQAQRHTVLRLSEVDIGLDFWESLFARAPVAKRIVLHGIQLSLVRDAGGGLHIDGLGQQQPARPNFLRRIRLPRELSIVSSTVNISGVGWGSRSLEIAQVDLRFRQERQQFRCGGSGKLDDGAIKLMFAGTGQLASPDWNGKLYLELQDLALARLQALSGKPFLSGISGTASLKLWSTWTRARPQDLTADLAVSDLNLQPTGPGSILTSLQARLNAVRSESNRWRGEIADLRAEYDGKHWDAERALFNADFGKSILVNMSSFPLPPLQALSPKLHILALSGDLLDLRYRYDPEVTQAGRHTLQTQVRGMTLRSNLRTPGIEGLTAAVRANASRLEIDLPQQAVQVHWPERLPKPISVAGLYGRLNGQWQDPGWAIQVPKLSVRNRDIDFSLHGAARGSPETGPVTDLAADIHRARLDHFADYVPSSLPPRGREWLSRAIKAGIVSQGRVVLKGPLRQFPFTTNPENFTVVLPVQEGLLQFAPTWPAIDHIRCEVLMQGPRLSVRLDDALMFQNKLRKVDVVLPDLFHRGYVLDIKGEAEGSTTSAMGLVNNSPLRERVGKRLESLDVGGNVGLSLNLVVPLTPGEPANVHGWLHFPGNPLTEHKLKLTLADLTGVLEFTNQRWFGQGLSARFLDQPTTLDFELINDNTAITLYGKATQAFVLKRLEELVPGIGKWAENNPLFEIKNGATVPWIAKVQLPPKGAPPRLRVESDLRGLSIAVPVPIQKKSEDVRRLIVDASLGKSDEPLSFNYDNTLHGQLQLRRTARGVGFDGARLFFGEQEKPNPHLPSWWIGGTIPRISTSEWLNLFNKIKSLNIYSERPLPVIDADLNLREAEVLGQTFKDLRVDLSHNDWQWLLKFASPQAAGRVSIARDLGAAKIDASFERLYITKELTEGIHQHIDPRRFPPLALRCEDLKLGELPLGALSLSAKPQANGIHIAPIHWSSPNFTITGEGDWTQAEGHDERSQFRLNVRAPKLAQLLGSFGFSPPKIKDSATELLIDAAWPNTPAHFSLAKLEGTMRMSIKDGRFVEVEPSAGRVFGLLSLQALPRRLSLDFRDLFKKGLTFDIIQGSFRFKHGQAYTKDLSLDGPTVRIDIVGRTGLVDLDYDQTVTVTPPVSNTLPAASVVFGPVGAAVGGSIWLAGKVFREIPDNIDRMFSYQYSLKGRWENPSIERTGKGRRVRDKPGSSQANDFSVRDSSLDAQKSN